MSGLLSSAPRFTRILDQHDGGFFRGNRISASPDESNKRGERMLALVDDTMLPRILDHLFSEGEFLSPYGIRSVSKVHDVRRNLGEIRGIGAAIVEYVPGESNSPLFGGQLQLAWSDLDAYQLHPDPDARKILSLSGRRLSGQSALLAGRNAGSPRWSRKCFHHGSSTCFAKTVTAWCQPVPVLSQD